MLNVDGWVIWLGYKLIEGKQEYGEKKIAHRRFGMNLGIFLLYG